MRNIAFVSIILIMVGFACKTPKPSIYQPPVEQVEAVIEPEATVAIEKMPETPIMMKTEEVTLANEENIGEKMFDYYVILGSFQLLENANKLQAELKNKGNISVVLKSAAGMYRVAVKGTNSEFEARNLIGEIRVKSPEHSDVWLLKKK